MEPSVLPHSHRKHDEQPRSGDGHDRGHRFGHTAKCDMPTRTRDVCEGDKERATQSQWSARKTSRRTDCSRLVPEQRSPQTRMRRRLPYANCLCLLSERMSTLCIVRFPQCDSVSIDFLLSAIPSNDASEVGTRRFDAAMHANFERMSCINSWVLFNRFFDRLEPR